MVPGCLHQTHKIFAAGWAVTRQLITCFALEALGRFLLVSVQGLVWPSSVQISSGQQGQGRGP